MAETFEITERRGVGVATVMARRGIDAAALGPDFPTAPRCVTTGGTTVVGVGPGVWLVVGDQRGEAWPEGWERRLEGRCSISDQSGAYVVLNLSGAGACALLQRGVAIDLHPEVFVAGSAATTVIAHIGVILWRPNAGDVFELAVFRSYAASFRRWIAAQTL